MDVVTSLIAIAVLLGLLLFVRRNAKKENVRPDELTKTTTLKNTKFHAVSIRFAPNACAAAKNMEGRRFLSSAAPKIPLPECDATECKCRFKHHQDRRAGDDRRNAWGQGFGSAATGQYPKEQRKGRDRRDNSPEEYFD
jgi:hypothetical protein